MESYLLSDNDETLQGMRMAGILGEVLDDKELIIKKIDELILDSNIGIIILTQKVKNLVFEEIMERKIQAKDTLIVEIPGPKEKIREDVITNYIRESIGIKL